MFLPIGDEPNPRRLSVVNLVLIAANVGVFLLVSLPRMVAPVDYDDPLLPEYLRLLSAQVPRASLQELLAQISAYDLFIYRHGFRPAEANLVDLFTSLFLHAGWLHLTGNMLFLWIFGDNVEARLGKLGYLLGYLGTGVAATLFFMLFQEDTQTPLVGASGAISGVLGCYFVWFPKNRVRVLMVLFVFVDVWRVPARVVLAIYVLIDNLLPFLMNEGASGVAHGAHLGGFLGGWLLASFLGAASANELVTEAPESELRRALGRGDWVAAAELYARLSLSERGRLDDADVLLLADALTRQGRYDAALAIVQHFVTTRPTSPALPHAYLRAGLLQLTRGQLAAARQHFLSALDLDPPPDVATAARQGLMRTE